MSRHSIWIKGQPGLCGSSAQAVHLPFPRMATWECFLSLAMASSCARMGLVTHLSPTPQGWHPTSPGSLGNMSQAVQLPTDLSNAVPRPNAPRGSTSTGLLQNCLDSGKACTGDQSCCFPQAPTRLHFDLLLSHT